jgi:cytochrome c oxidase cbb3-type subunit 3
LRPAPWTGIPLYIVLALLLSACAREDRDFRAVPPGASPPVVVPVGQLQPGPPTPVVHYTVYENNAWAISEGKRLFNWFNCAACHSAGGGGSFGPPLIDQEWRYGSAPEQIFQTIQEGRPRGMPSFRGRISTDDTWKIVAYVRSMSEHTPIDTWSGRGDVMEEANPEPAEGPARDTEPDSARLEPDTAKRSGRP